MRKCHHQLDPQTIAGAGDNLYRELSEKVIGQEPGIRAIVQAFQKRAAGLSRVNQPIGSFLFLGPSGTGKTYLVEKAAEVLAGTEKAVLTIDCSEFQDDISIGRLIGSAPGYVGHKDTTPLLTQEALDRYLTKQCQTAFVLFDEIEKMHPKIWHLMLGILSKARMKTSTNKLVSFERCMIFFTSNLGAAEMAKFIDPMGFGNKPGREETALKLEKIGAAAARKRFSKEFFERLDHVVTFRPLEQAEYERILILELEKTQNAIYTQLQHLSYGFVVSKPALAQMLVEAGTENRGARQLGRTVDRVLVHPLANLVSSDQIKPGDMALLDYIDGQFRFFREFTQLSRDQLDLGTYIFYNEGMIPTYKDLKAVPEKPAA